MRGRKPAPTALKLIRGNPGKRALPKGEPKPDIETPDPPEHLTERALAEWTRVVPMLLAMGVLAQIDRAALAAYCVVYARWVEAEEHVAKHGAVVKAPRTQVLMGNPFLSVANNAMAQMDRFGAKFGMSPQDRVRLAVDTPKTQPEEDRYFA